MLQFIGSQRVGRNWVPELNWTELKGLLLLRYNLILTHYICNDLISKEGQILRYYVLGLDIFGGFLSGSEVKNLPAMQKSDMALISGSGISPGGGNSYLLQDSCLKNPMDRGAWRPEALGVTESWTQLSLRLLGDTSQPITEAISSHQLLQLFVSKGS